MLAVAVGFVAAPVFGERSQSQNLVIYLRGGVSPRTLPRDHTRPVAMRLQAGIGTVNSVPLPRVKEIRLELAYRGTLDTYGLPVCGRARLRALDTRHAIAACGDALVGTGKPLRTRLPAVPGPVRPPCPPARLQRQDLTGPHRDLGPRLLARSTHLLRPPLPRPPPAGPFPHRARQRRPPRRRALASLRSFQHGRLPPLSATAVACTATSARPARCRRGSRRACSRWPAPPSASPNGPDLDVETVRTCRAVR